MGYPKENGPSVGLANPPQPAKKHPYSVRFASHTLNGMQLKEADIQEFIQLWREEFREELSVNQARHRATQLLELYLVLAKVPSGRLGTSSGSSLGATHP